MHVTLLAQSIKRLYSLKIALYNKDKTKFKFVCFFFFPMCFDIREYLGETT